MLVPFVKVDSVNPVMGAGTGKFFCPILKRVISWKIRTCLIPQ
jgi:hypothetical protein